MKSRYTSCVSSVLRFTFKVIHKKGYHGSRVTCDVYRGHVPLSPTTYTDGTTTVDAPEVLRPLPSSSFRVRGLVLLGHKFRI